MKSTNRFIPLWLAISTIIGIVIGSFYGNHFQSNLNIVPNRMNIIKAGSNKLGSLFYILEDLYVDTVNVQELVDKAIPFILSELDPHSSYFTAKDAQQADDDLRGSFSGVGIEFIIRNDTLRVQRILPDGPAEAAGLMAGDKIVTVDGTDFTGEELTNESAMRRLKGARGSKVTLGIMRYGDSEVREFNVTRADIHTQSVVAAYMVDDATGYMRIRNFGRNTYPEVLVALVELSQEGCQNLIIDLRGNPGGLLEAAVMIANEFLPGGRMITYTEGRRKNRENYTSDGHGAYTHIPLVVLIDESSCSASEILAGAIQDNDRGTIIGRRSYGKGLVQEPMGFDDGSMMRLTVARYYTPSGRCIQRPYTSGQDYEYQEEIYMRYINGEVYSEDSIKHTGPKYHTKLGRVVYGGGGITPDIFVGADTTNFTSYYKEASLTGLIMQYAYDYVDRNRQKLAELDDGNQIEKYLHKQNIPELFAQYADEHGLKRRNLMLQKSATLIEEDITDWVVRIMFDDQAEIKYRNQTDPAVLKAQEVFKAGNAFPQKP